MPSISTVLGDGARRSRIHLFARHDGPWQAPEFSMPIALVEGSPELTLLGELSDFRGTSRRWFASQWGDLAETDDLVSERSEAIPNGPALRIVDEDGERLLRLLRVHAPGTFAQRSTPARKSARVPAPSRPADALYGASILRVRTRSAGPLDVRYIRGAEAIVTLLARRGGVTLLAIGESLVPAPGGGRLIPGVIDVLAKARRLLLPYVRDGKPPTCAFGCGNEAVTVADAVPEPIEWCGVCTEKKEKKRNAA